MHNGQSYVGTTVSSPGEKLPPTQELKCLAIKHHYLFLVQILWGFFPYQIEPKKKIFSIKTVKTNLTVSEFSLQDFKMQNLQYFHLQKYGLKFQKWGCFVWSS